MKKFISIFVALTLLFVSKNALGQSSKSYQNQLSQQKKQIQKAYKKQQLSLKEYNKLVQEQDVIKNSLEKAERDGNIDKSEQKHLNGKLDRAANRLKKYKSNNEH